MRAIVSIFLSLALFINAIPAFAAYPIVAQRLTSRDNVNDTTTTISNPSSISAGNLLIHIIAFYSGGTTPDATLPTGWTLVREWECNSTDGQCFEYIIRRVADGTEGATLAITTTASRKASACSYRITGHASSGTILSETIAAGSSANADPNALNPGVTKDYLAIVGGAWNSDISGINITEPSGYTTDQSIATTVQTVTCASAEKNVTASSENPGAWTHASQLWATSTILVHPESSGARRRLPGLVRAFDWFLAPRAYAAEAWMETH